MTALDRILRQWRVSTARPMVALFAFEEGVQLRRLRALTWAVAIGLGFLQAWATRHTMNPDGISYLDMGDAYWRGDWQHAINAYWSPLYSWILGLVMLVVRPSPYWEFPTVHLVNFVLYVVALACFEFFLRSLVRHHRHRASNPYGDGVSPLPEWAFRAWGYALFVWVSLDFITISFVTPDMCVAAFVYLAAGIVLRISTGRLDWLWFVLLGVVLGFGYLAKASMFPMAFVFLGVSLFAAGNLRKAIPRVLVALLTLGVIAGPFILALSLQKGHPTFGDSGKLNYARYIGGVPALHWQGEPVGSGTPKHPTRKIFDEPAVYEFGSPVGGTIPVWYDPSYWYDGIETHFDLQQQIRVVINSIRTYYDEIFSKSAAFIVGLLVLLALLQSRVGLRAVVWQLGHAWVLVVPAVANLGMMALVLVQPRYVGPYVVLMFLGLLSGVGLTDSRESGRVLGALMVAIVLTTMIPLTIGNVYSAGRSLMRMNQSTEAQLQVVDGLRQAGINPDDEVAHIGDSVRAYWARMARVRIVAQIVDGGSLWAADSDIKSQVMSLLGSTGAKAVIADGMPPEVASDMAWERIGNTSYFIHLLSEKTP